MKQPIVTLPENLPDWQIERNFMGQIRFVDNSSHDPNGVMVDGIKPSTGEPFESINATAAVDAKMNAYKSSIDPK